MNEEITFCEESIAKHFSIDDHLSAKPSPQFREEDLNLFAKFSYSTAFRCLHKTRTINLNLQHYMTLNQNLYIINFGGEKNPEGLFQSKSIILLVF